MKKFLAGLAFLVAAFGAQATPVNVNFSFDSIATGSFSYDSSLDGTTIGYNNLDSFVLTFAGLTTSVYDLAFVNAGNSSAWHFFQFNSATDSFLSQNIAGFPTTLADIKNTFNQGFFVRDDAKIIRDYAGGGDQNYANLSISVDRNAVPEPATLAILSLGLFGIAAARRRKQ